MLSYRYQVHVTNSPMSKSQGQDGLPEATDTSQDICDPVIIRWGRMDSNGPSRSTDESLLRELPQLSLRIAPLRDQASSRNLSVPSLLDPNTNEGNDIKSVPRPPNPTGNAPAPESLPTVNEFVDAARTKKAKPPTEPHSTAELPPKPILPAFVNLRALERVPFSSSFDGDTLHGPRKRRRLESQVETFGEHLQLPIPQAQKEQRPAPFGPFAILNGLNEPPPNAALLPPIEASSSISHLLNKPSRGVADEADAGAGGPVNSVAADGQPAERREAKLKEILNANHDEHNADEHIRDPDTAEPAARGQTVIKTSASTPLNEQSLAEESSPPKPHGTQPLSPKSRGRSRKNLRKWTEDETTDLLRGVVKCGIGNWTTILAQPGLKFNQRTASNLKDRFRVCCPWAYRASDPNEAIKQLRDHLANTLLKAHAEGSNDNPGRMRPPITSLTSTSSESSTGSMSSSANSHKPSASSMSSGTLDTEHSVSGTANQPSSATPIPNFSPSASETTLESLGIPEAHVSTKSKRRSRRPFTTAEDEALLKGHAAHGFQWTLIQQDKHLNLGHRKATDLRDRFRTKFPHVYRDGGSLNGKALTTPTQEPEMNPTAPVPRDGPVSTGSTPTKAASVAQRRTDVPNHSRQSSGSFDPSFLPPPQGFLEPSGNSLSFGLDENAATGPSSPWEDNTLAPMVWDDLG